MVSRRFTPGDEVNYLKQVEEGIQGILTQTWDYVLAHIKLPSTKALLLQHGQLLSLSNGQARIGISSEQLRKLAETKLPEIEAAFRAAYGYNIKVSLEVLSKPFN